MRLKAILELRCPHCMEGQVFSGFLKMNENCPVCGIEYEREHGFFMMSIFIGYILGFIAVVPFMVALFLMNAQVYAYFVVSAVLLIPLSPFIFRYSRILWLHIDEILDPRPTSPLK